jgi:hypothetical protein
VCEATCGTLLQQKSKGKDHKNAREDLKELGIRPGLYVEETKTGTMSYGPPWAHYLGGHQDRLLGGPLGLPSLRYTAPEGVEHKDYTGVVLG